MKEIEIKDVDVGCLQKASMSFITWELFRELIEEAKDYGFPYEKFGNVSLKQPDRTVVPIKGTEILKRNIDRNQHIGIDVPVLLKPDGIDSKGTICIVGESPLREPKDFNSTNDILLGTPYAVHQDFGCPPRCNVYKKIFNDLLEAGYSIYLTDIIKIWWKDKDLKFDKEIDEKLLKDELQTLDKDVIIVAWGKRAEYQLKKMNLEFLYLPHPSKRNRDCWKLRIFKKAIYEIGVDYAKNIFPSRDDICREINVANEAVKEILEYCKQHKVKHLN